MTDNADDVEKKIAAIHASFAGKLTGKISDIKQAAAEFKQATTPASAQEAQKKLNLLSHTLAGAAPTFGFPEIGELALKIEAMTMPDQNPDENLDPLIQNLENLIT